jgi:hypothetical protein
MDPASRISQQRQLSVEHMVDRGTVNRAPFLDQLVDVRPTPHA